MKFILLTILLTPCLTGAQVTDNARNPDTSYTYFNEFRKHVKNFPQLAIVHELHPGTYIQRKDIIYCNTGNRNLLLDVFTPVQESKTPATAIIFLHGGGWRSGNRSMHYPLVQRLAALGYVCITPGYRLSGEAIYPAAIHDIKSAVQWVRAHAREFNLDTARIVIAGHSAGGELAAFTGATNGNAKFDVHPCYAKYSSHVNAVIDLDGLLAFIHPESGEGDDSKKISSATQFFGASKRENPALWMEGSPLTHVGAKMPPILFINSSVTRMHAGREDFISIMNRHRIYSDVKAFAGAPHSFVLFNPWFDSTIIYIDNFCREIFNAPRFAIKEITVSQDGKGHFASVQAAFNIIPQNNNDPISICIKKGIYYEKLHLDSLKKNITLVGENPLETILTFNDHSGKIAPGGDTINTRTSWSFKIKGDDFTARNITFQNDAGFTAGQAVAVESAGDRAKFISCRFIGNQDVLFTSSDNSRQYFWDCYIEGTTDFIFGSSTAWFEYCHIHSKKNSHITAASTPKENAYGYIFNHCKLTGDTSLHNVSLGRPWRPFANTIYMNSWIGAHIKPEGWSNWNNTDNYRTTRYAEYANTGPSSNPAGRVTWVKQLTKEEAEQVNIKNVFGDWNPLKK